MGMARIKKSLVVFINIAVFTAAYFAFAQYILIEQKRVEVSRSLSGHVNVGMESPAENVTVELRSPDWNKVLASTKTDKVGYFSFGNVPGELFYVHFSSPGINPFQLRVRIKKSAKRDLTI